MNNLVVFSSEQRPARSPVQPAPATSLGTRDGIQQRHRTHRSESLKLHLWRLRVRMRPVVKTS